MNRHVHAVATMTPCCWCSHAEVEADAHDAVSHRFDDDNEAVDVSWMKMVDVLADDIAEANFHCRSCH